MILTIEDATCIATCQDDANIEACSEDMSPCSFRH